MHRNGTLRRAGAFLGLLTLGAHATEPSICCTQLSNVLPQAVYFPNSATPRGGDPTISYEFLNTHRWSNTSILNPACIFYPITAGDLSTAVKSLVGGKCPISVKAGGHTPIPGANDIDGGVSIDLGGLNQTVYLPSNKGDVVRLGTGANWQMAYDALVVQHSIGFPGGLCGTTGVGGVSMGGGQSVFQAKVGWVIDSIVEYEIVLANGDIVVANEKQRPDLFKALKGGGLAANFGIATRVDLKAFPLPGGNVWGGSLVMPVTDDNKAKVLQAITDYTALNNDDVDAASQVLISYGSTGQSMIEIALFNGAPKTTSKALQPFLALSDLNVAGVGKWGPITLPELIKSFDPAQPWGLRDLGATVSFVNDIATVQAVQKVTDDIFNTLKYIPGLNFNYIYTPQPQVTNSYSAAAGGNMLGLAGTTIDRVVVLLVPSWEDPQYDNAITQAMQDWAKQVQAATAALGKGDGFQYANFAGAFQKPLCTYGPDNVKFMQTTAAKYDPNSVFQTLAPGGIKLANAC